MRQFVFGILAAALALWGYQRWQEPGQQAPGQVDAAKVSGAGQGTGGGESGLILKPASNEAGRLDDMIGRGPTSGDNTPVDGRVDTVVAALENGNAAGIDAAWVLLAGGLPLTDRQRLVGLVQPRPGADGDFAALLAALGTRNTFLFSAEGRELATRAFGALGALGDEAKCAGGSKLVTLCLRGRIEKGDVQQRQFVDDLYRMHRSVVDRWLCDPANVTRARSHTIEAGKGLGAVASKFRREGIYVDAGCLAVLNRIHNPNLVRAGQQIKVPVEPIKAVLEKRSFSLAVYVGDDLLRLYWVGHGAEDKTPVTEFTVVEKKEHPPWTAPNGRVYPYGHPENILGEYFIKFEHPSYVGFGAHGTPQPETLCTMSSAGCIRMGAADIEDLFQILPRGAKVEVRANEAPLR